MTYFHVDRDRLRDFARSHDNVGDDFTEAANDVPTIDAGIAADLVATLVNSLVQEIGSAGMVSYLIAEQMRDFARDASLSDEEAAESFAVAGSAVPGFSP